MQTSTQAFDDAVNQAFAEFEQEIHDTLSEAGEAGVRHNIENGNYQDHTRHLRSSNYYKVNGEGLEQELEIGNSADYAGDVEARGYMVCSEGILVAVNKLNGN